MFLLFVLKKEESRYCFEIIGIKKQTQGSANATEKHVHQLIIVAKRASLSNGLLLKAYFVKCFSFKSQAEKKNFSSTKLIVENFIIVITIKII